MLLGVEVARRSCRPRPGPCGVMAPARCSSASARLVLPGPAVPDEGDVADLTRRVPLHQAPPPDSGIGVRARVPPAAGRCPGNAASAVDAVARDDALVALRQARLPEGRGSRGARRATWRHRCSTDAGGPPSRRACSPSAPTSGAPASPPTTSRRPAWSWPSAAAVAIANGWLRAGPPAAGAHRACPTCSTAPWPRRPAPPRRGARSSTRSSTGSPTRCCSAAWPGTWRRPSRAASRCCRWPCSAASMLVSYERAKAESLGFDARGGLMERAERLIVLGFGLLFDVAARARPVGDAGPHLFTAVQRFVKVWRQASAPAASSPSAARWRTRRVARSTQRDLASPGAWAHRRAAATAAAGGDAGPPCDRARGPGRPLRTAPRSARGAEPARAGVVDVGRAHWPWRGLLAAGERPARDGRAPPAPGRPEPRAARRCAGAVRRRLRVLRPLLRRVVPPAVDRPRASSTPASTYEGYEHIERAVDAGNGPILCLPHLGSWEWAAFWLTRVQRLPVTAVVERIEPPGAVRLVRRTSASARHARRAARARRRPGDRGRGQGGPRRRACCATATSRGGGVEVEFFGERTTLPVGPGRPRPAHRARRCCPTAVYDRGPTATTASSGRRCPPSGRAGSATTSPASPRPSPTSSRG